MANFAEKGILPRRGGLMDQRQRDLAMIQVAWSEISQALQQKISDGQ